MTAPADHGARAPGAAPTVSVLLPNYNHARYLGTALGALAAQQQAPDEILVIDDASTDDSIAVIEGFGAALPQLRVLRNTSNLGVVKTLNRGLAEASGSHVLCSASDDWLEPGFLARMVGVLTEYPEARIAVSDYVQYFEADARFVHHGSGSELGPWYAPDGPRYVDPDELRQLLRRGEVWLPTNAALIERAALAAIGGFDPALRWHADWFAMYTLALRYGFAVLPEPLSVFRVAAATYSGVGMRDRRRQREVCAAIYDKLCEPEYADIREALRRHPAAFSTFFHQLAEVLMLRPREWPYLASLAGWWLGEVRRGRRPGLLRDLIAARRRAGTTKS